MTQIPQQSSGFDLLPNELISKIFMYSARRMLNFHERHRFPIILLLTCRYWRDVAICTPELWTDVWLRRTGSLDHAATRLRKSGTLPLTIELDVGGHLDDQINLIIPHISRWSSLSLLFLDVTSLLRVHSLLPPIAPNLAQLTVTAAYPRQLGTAPALPRIMEMPNLKSLNLSQMNTQWLEWPLQGLEELIVSCPLSLDATQMGLALAECSSLRRLTLKGLTMKILVWNQRDQLSNICLSTLEELRFDRCGSCDVADFLHMRTPALQKMRIAYETDFIDRAQRRFGVTAVANKRPELRSLSLHYVRSGIPFLDFLSSVAPEVDYLAASADVLEALKPTHFRKLRTISSVHAGLSTLRSIVLDSRQQLSVLNTHVENMGLPASQRKEHFDQLCDDRKAIQERVKLNTFGTVTRGRGQALYKCWEDRVAGRRLTDQFESVEEENIWL